MLRNIEQASPELRIDQMLFYIADLMLDLDTLTGITDVMDTFSKPPCKDHTPMP